MLEQLRMRAAPGPADDTLWIFLHIPKTAGSSFRNAMAERLKPDHNINIDKLRGVKKRNPAFREAIDEFLALDREKRFRFASGHLKMAEALRIRESLSRPVRLLTMLRDPVQRVISDYRYQRTPAHPLHEKFCAAFPTLESFVQSRRSQNKMFRHLALPGDSVEGAIARLEREFSLIGLVEMYPLSLKLCSELIGTAIPTSSRLNVTQTTGGNEVEVSDALADRIRALNGKDEVLWSHFHRRLQSLAYAE